MRIGIDLGSTNVRMGIIDSGQILLKITEPCKADKSEKESLDHIIQMIHSIMNTNIRGIGIGVPSVVDSERGIVYNAVNIPSWKEVHLKEILEKEFNVPVAVNNNCNCFAFGERYYGEGTAYRNIVCLSLSIGVGAGIIIEDRLYCGNNTGAGEIGSLPYLNYDYEYYCSSQFLAREYNLSIDEALKRAETKDSQVLQIWNEIGTHIGNLLKVILFTYDPEAIVIRGSISQGYKYFSNKMYEVLNTFPYPETVKRLKILLSKREDIGLFGASALIRS